MKQLIMYTVISIFVVGGFLTAPWGQDLIGATATEAS